MWEADESRLGPPCARAGNGAVHTQLGGSSAVPGCVPAPPPCPVIPLLSGLSRLWCLQPRLWGRLCHHGIQMAAGSFPV